jgi:hypothetical protein
LSEDVTSGPTPDPGEDEPTVVIPAVRVGVPPSSPSDVTQPIEPVGAVSTAGGAPRPPWEADDGDDEWQVSAPSNRLKMRLPTAILLALLLAAGAFWGGAAVQRSDGSSSGLASAFAGAAARLRGGGAAGTAGAAGATGSSGFASLFGGGGASATVGTVTDVQGSTIYITNSAGDIVKVVLSPTAKITRTATVSASGLTLGDTVIVQGATAKNGTVTATSVAATAAGTTATAAGRGGFGGG